MNYKGYEAVIGLEIHAQLKTKSKIFCADSTEFDALDNANTSPLTLGMPGTLPVVNKKVIEFSIKAGLAFNCQIRNRSVFARKNYFYPDLSKGYQISQYDQPICENGYVEFINEGQKKRVGITRAHMEEDAGKSTHFGNYSLINYNRAGIPLLEIVSEPELDTPQEAAEYARTIRNILRYLEVCDGNLEEGSLRCDCNVSVRKIGDKKLGTKVELKNINSFKFVEKALEYEIQRQVESILSGDVIIQETRLYDSTKNKTYSMRSKENADDYRYFPDPDLLPIIISRDWIQKIKDSLPELPVAKIHRFQTEFALSEFDSYILTQEKEVAEYFEATAKDCASPKLAANWIMSELMRELNESGQTISKSLIRPHHLAALISLIESNAISGKIAKRVFAEMWKSGEEPEQIIKKLGLVQISDTNELEKMIDQVLSDHPKELAEYRSGKEKVFGFFVGQVMRVSRGQASPSLLNEVLKRKLQS